MHELLSASATRLAAAIRDKHVSSAEMIRACLDRIDAVNPQLNAVVHLCRERALTEAQERDRAVASGESLGPLHGVPMTIKDTFDTAGVQTTYATLGRADHVPTTDATAVARVRAAGAVLIGKTNTPRAHPFLRHRQSRPRADAQSLRPHARAGWIERRRRRDPRRLWILFRHWQRSRREHPIARALQRRCRTQTDHGARSSHGTLPSPSRSLPTHDSRRSPLPLRGRSRAAAPAPQRSRRQRPFHSTRPATFFFRGRAREAARRVLRG